MTVSRAGGVLAALMLSACGGSGGSTGSIALPQTPPTPSPSPAPAPSPTPTPAPITYATIYDLSASQYTRSEAASVTIQRRYTSGATPLYAFESATARLNSDPQALLYDYDATNRAVRMQIEGRTIAIPSTAMLRQTDDGMRSTLIALDADSDAVLLLSRWSNAFRYFAFSDVQLNWRGFPDAGAKVSRESYYRFLIGTPTRNGDMPQSGTRDYGASLDSSTATYDGSGGLIGSAPITVNFAARTVTGTFAASQSSWVTGTERLTVTLRFEGSIDIASNVIEGRVTNPEGYTGTFRGRLFGPATEIGLIFAIERAGKGVVGTIGGVSGI